MRFLFCLLLFFSAGAVASAETSQRSAREAQALLGPTTWTRVIRVENHNRRSAYAPTFYALVFEYADRLWFYTEADGTQSFSLRQNDLAQEKADFAPLLRAIDPGLTSYQIVEIDTTRSAMTTRPAPGELRNGCLIESIVALREKLAHGEAVLNARLLMYYSDERVAGHCVLVYETVSGIFVTDSGLGGSTHRIANKWPATDLRLARAAAPGRSYASVTQARSLTLPLHEAVQSNYLASTSAAERDAAGTRRTGAPIIK